MLARVGILTAIVNSTLLTSLGPFLGLSIAAGALALIVLLRRAPAAQDQAPQVTNPFRLTEAVKFAAVYAVVLFAVEAANRYLGTWGILAAAVLPMILRTLYLSLRKRYPQHRRLARWTFPIWAYVSLTGVFVYLMLYHVGPSRAATSSAAAQSAQVAQ